MEKYRIETIGEDSRFIRDDNNGDFVPLAALKVKELEKKQKQLCIDNLKENLAALEAQKEAWRDNKRDFENDVALKMEQIAALEQAVKEKDDAYLWLTQQMQEQISALTARAESLDRIITEDTEREVALTAANAKLAEEVEQIYQNWPWIKEDMEKGYTACHKAALNGEKEAEP